MTHARLNGTDFSGAKNLKADQLADACGDASTRLPAYLQATSLELCPPE